MKNIGSKTSSGFVSNAYVCGRDAEISVVTACDSRLPAYLSTWHVGKTDTGRHSPHFCIPRRTTLHGANIL